MSSSSISHEPAAPVTPHPPRKRFTGAIAGAVALIIVALLAAGIFRAVNTNRTRGSQGASSPTATARPQATATPRTGIAALVNPNLTAIAMTSPTDGWIAGDSEGPDPNGPGYIFFLHMQHGTLTLVPPLTPTIEQITSISMDSPTDGWAVGFAGITFHYDGHAWKQVADRGLPGALDYSQVQMVTPNNGWIITGPGSSNGVIVHYDGSHWTQQPMPTSLTENSHIVTGIFGIDMLPSGEGWAVGASYPIQSGSTGSTPGTGPTGLILHYIGGQWSVQATFDHMLLQSVSMASAEQGWAVGETEVYQQGQSDVTTPALVHFSQGTWTVIPDPVANNPTLNAGLLTQVVMNSPTDGWALGNFPTPSISQTGEAANNAILLHYDGSSWQVVTLPGVKSPGLSPFTKVSQLGFASDGSGWLVGWLNNGTGDSMLIFRYQHGAWRFYQS